jgi:hypothetical protein
MTTRNVENFAHRIVIFKQAHISTRKWHIPTLILTCTYFAGLNHRDSVANKTIMNQKNEGESYQDYLKCQGLDEMKENNKNLSASKGIPNDSQICCHYIHWLEDVSANTPVHYVGCIHFATTNALHTNFFVLSFEFLRRLPSTSSCNSSLSMSCKLDARGSVLG